MRRSTSALVAGCAGFLFLAGLTGEPAKAQTDDLKQCQDAKQALAKSLLECGTALAASNRELHTCRTQPCVQLESGKKCDGLVHLTAQQALELLLADGKKLDLDQTARLTELSVSLLEEKAPLVTRTELPVLKSHLRVSKDRLTRATAAAQRAEARGTE